MLNVCLIEIAATAGDWRVNTDNQLGLNSEAGFQDRNLIEVV